MKPLVAITIGDPAGVGPEIVVKALNNEEIYQKVRPLVIGSRKMLERIAPVVGNTMQFLHTAAMRFLINMADHGKKQRAHDAMCRHAGDSTADADNIQRRKAQQDIAHMGNRRIPDDIF